VIDLTSVGHVDGTPAWKNIVPDLSDSHVYSYNPCHPFTQSSCKNVAACQTFASDEKTAYSLGTQNSLQWKFAPSQEYPTLIYKTTERTLHVDLQCLSSGEPDKLEVHGQDPKTGLYNMTLSSKCVCWNGCKDKPSPDPNPQNRLSIGAIFIIALVALVTIYLVVFISFNKLKRQATGIEILPHRTFWVSLPR
ncbi:unnamed protein product, partial [Rotaria sordida]